MPTAIEEVVFAIKPTTDDSETLSEAAAKLRDLASTLEEMEAEGLQLWHTPSHDGLLMITQGGEVPTDLDQE